MCHVTMVSKFPWISTNYDRKKKDEKIDTYEFPVHCTQGQNDSPYFSSIVGQCKWPSLSRKILEVQNFCNHGNMTSHFSSV